MATGNARLPARAHARGFTLFEVMVVVFVIGLFAVWLLPEESWIRTNSPLRQEAIDLANTLEILRDEAALQGRNFGIRFEPAGYEILDLDPDSGAWLTISDDDFLVPRQFGENTLITLEVEDREIELERQEDEQDQEQQLDAFGNPIETATTPPHIVVLTSGEVTPFELSFEQFGSDEFVRLDGDAFGELELLNERP